jgi:hypothetical protein
MTLEEQTRKTLSGGGKWKPNATDKGLIEIARMLDELERDLRGSLKARQKRDAGKGPKFGTKEWLRNHRQSMRRFAQERRKTDKELRRLLKELDSEGS